MRKLLFLQTVFMLLFLSVLGQQSASAITRDEVISRAKSWSSIHVTYSQQAPYREGYRRDCSGYVSYCWATSNSGGGYNTNTLQDITNPISVNDLKPGDILLNTAGGNLSDKFAHTLIFDQWANNAHTSYFAYEEGPNYADHHQIDFPYWGGWNPKGYSPRRYKDIEDTLPDGLYRASNEATVFLVTNAGRRAVPSGDCFNDWGMNWNAVHVVDEATLYSRTTWQPPIAHLVKTASSATVYWIVQIVTNQPYANHYFARPISSADVFNQMGFSWGDLRVVNYNPTQRYSTGPTLSSVEPRLVVNDGPYEGTYNTYFTAGWRVRNLSNSGNYGVAVTIRAYRTDGYWFDFGWSGSGGVDPNNPIGWSPAWMNVSKSGRHGSYSMSVIYGYQTSHGGIQIIAPGSGDYQYPSSANSFSY